MRKPLLSFIQFAGIFLLCAGAGPAPKGEIFSEMAAVLQQGYWDLAQLGPLWSKVQRDISQQLGSEAPPPKITEAGQALCRQLSPASCGFYGQDDQEYWALASAFADDLRAQQVRHHGAWFVRKGKRWFVQDVFPAGPAAVAGLKEGDEVSRADQGVFTPAGPPNATDDRDTLAYRRHPWDKPLNITLGTVTSSYGEAFLAATRASETIFTEHGFKIGYLRLWSGSPRQTAQVVQEIVERHARRSDALILDLRSGVNRLQGDYARFFVEDPKTPNLPLYDKPMVVLLNATVAGDKERLAQALAGRPKTTSVGQPTAGMPLSTAIAVLTAGPYLLHFATRGDPHVAVTQVLQPTVPTVTVEETLVYKTGVDLILRRGQKEAVALLRGK